MHNINSFIPLFIFLAIVIIGIVLKIVLPPETKIELSKGALALLISVGIIIAIAMTVLTIFLIMGSPTAIN